MVSIVVSFYHRDSDGVIIVDDDETQHSRKSARACKTVFPAPLILVLVGILTIIFITFILHVILLWDCNETSKDIRVYRYRVYYMYIYITYVMVVLIID